MGLCCENGHIVSLDKNIAVKYLLQAAARGNVSASYKLGDSFCLGNGVDQNYEKSLRYYSVAANRGNHRAINMLGLEKAQEWYRKAAGNNHVSGQYSLDFCYYYGHGIQKDYEQAFYWFKAAAERGDSWSQYYLGRCYLYGQGTDADSETAVYWLECGAKKAEEYNSLAVENGYQE